jgi:hypothetical protein
MATTSIAGMVSDRSSHTAFSMDGSDSNNDDNDDSDDDGCAVEKSAVCPQYVLKKSVLGVRSIGGKDSTSCTNLISVKAIQNGKSSW